MQEIEKLALDFKQENPNGTISEFLERLEIHKEEKRKKIDDLKQEVCDMVNGKNILIHKVAVGVYIFKFDITKFRIDCAGRFVYTADNIVSIHSYDCEATYGSAQIHFSMDEIKVCCELFEEELEFFIKAAKDIKDIQSKIGDKLDKFIS